MQTTIDNNHLVIRIPLEPPRPSASGKTLMVASTRGNVETDCLLNGRPIKVGLNAYIKPGHPGQPVKPAAEEVEPVIVAEVIE
jgi:hypothetical protein